jgi:O-succinylbenzoic acid--CoA ligase
MQDWLAARVLVSPEKTALISNDYVLSYRDINDLCLKMVFHLDAAQVRKGDTVGLLLNNHDYYVGIIFALIRIAVTLVPLNTRLNSEEIAFQLTNTNCKLCVYEESLYGKIEGNINSQIEYRSISTIFDWGTGEYSQQESILDDPLAIIHTSGTSGKPKGAILTYGNMFYSAMASAYRIGHMPDDKWLCVLPLYHVGGLSILIRAVLYGITVDLREKFDVAEINHALTHEDITLVSLVPTMLYRLLETRKDPWNPRLRLVLIGGAATTPELIERCKAENIPIATTYGLTEAASQVATTFPDDAIHKIGTVGKPLMFTQVRIIDENGKNQASGKYGEILVKGPTVMQGYYGDEDATHKTLRDEWLHTGDIGYFDEAHDLFLVQRRSDLIVSGGENIYPSEVEAVLKKHPAIKEIAVVGINDAEWGQQVAAAIILENGTSLTEDELEKYSREQLAAYKIPRIVKFVDELPMTGSGKIQRSGVKELFTM